MKHTPQAITTTPANARVVLDVAGDPASLPLSTAVQSQGDGRYLLASAVSPYMLTLLNDADAAAAFATLGGSSGPGWVRLPGGLLIQWGTAVGITTAGGGMAIGFSTAYSSSSSYTTVGFNGDAGSGVRIVANYRSGGYPQAGSFYVVCSSHDGSPIASTPMRVDWIAIGT